MHCEPRHGYYQWSVSGGSCPRCGAPEWQAPWWGQIPRWAGRDVQWPGEGYALVPIRRSPEQRYEPETIGDDVLQDRVYDTLQSDPRIPPEAQIAVEVRDRVAVLTGVVPDKWVKYMVGGDALSVPGINDVDNRIEIRRRGRKTASTQ